MRHIDTGCQASLVEGAAELVVAGHNLASGLHLGAQGDINIGHLIEGENRSLDSIIVRKETQARTEALLANADTHSAFGCHIHHGNAGNLAQEGYSSGRTRVNLDYINMVITDNVLNVDHAFYFQTQSHFIGIVYNGLDYGLA